ncbi:MAG: hypothetical protein LLG44_00070 [Chloroflexi bacterium]|nr:hypothetical protein [Chloroflexota bacterium]
MKLGKQLWPVTLFVVLGLLMAGCGTPTPVTCGVTSTGDPNMERFQESFTSVVLVSKSTGQPGQIGADGAAMFAADEQLSVRINAKVSGKTIRFCLQKTDSNGQIMYDQSVAPSEGEADYDIGAFQAGTYIVRLIERNVLIANLPFTIK